MKNEEIADDIELWIRLWNEYFNTRATMTDDDFIDMSFEDRLKLLNEEYPE